MIYICNICLVIFSIFAILSNIPNDIAALENNTSGITSNQANKSANIGYSYEPYLLLNGSEYFDIPHSKELSLENFTVASWIKANESNISNPAILVNKGGFNSEDKGKNMNYGFWFTSKGIIQAGFETESGDYYAVNTTKKYNDGEWHYIVFSNDGNKLKLYLDGNITSTKTIKGIKPDNTGSQPLRIGANLLEEEKFFNGTIDEVKVWNRGLTDSETNKLYAETNNTNDTISDQILYLNFSDKTVVQTTEVTQKETEQSFKDATEYKYVKEWGGAGEEDGQFLHPHDLDFNKEETIRL